MITVMLDKDELRDILGYLTDARAYTADDKNLTQEFRRQEVNRITDLENKLERLIHELPE